MIRGKGNATQKEPKFEVIEDCGTFAVRETKNGRQELKLRWMSWNDGDPRYDIRPWFEEDGKEKCLKGLGLSGEELISLRDLINKVEED